MSLKKYLGGSAMALALAFGGSSAVQADGSLVRIATVPAGAEVTGLSTNALGELFMNAQHPGCQRRGKNTPFAGAKIHHGGGVKVHQLL